MQLKVKHQTQVQITKIILHVKQQQKKKQHPRNKKEAQQRNIRNHRNQVRMPAKMDEKSLTRGESKPRMFANRTGQDRGKTL